MSDDGYSDEASPGSRGAGSWEADLVDAAPRPRRDWRITAFFTVLALTLVAFGGWAWATRVHNDDVAAYRFLAEQMHELDGDLLPVGRGERPPCGFTVDGWTERTWPASSGVPRELVEAILARRGWSPAPGTSQMGAQELQQDVAGRTVTLLLTTGEGARALVLTGTSPASSLACRFT